MTFVSESARFSFDTYLAATEALLVVMEDMRGTSRRYRITGRSPQALLVRGLLLEGEISEVSEKISEIDGAILQSSE